jgi:hypothetical protein
MCDIFVILYYSAMYFLFCDLIYGLSLVQLRILHYTSMLLSNESTNKMQQPQVYYLSFKYSSTGFGHPHAHHQELQLQ